MRNPPPPACADASHEPLNWDARGRRRVHWHWPAWGELALFGNRWVVLMLTAWWPASRSARRRMEAA